MFALHYSSGNFYKAKDKPVDITCITSVNIHTLDTKSFNLAEFNYEKVEDREKALLNEFYDYIDKNQDSWIVHWNMNNADYGFSAIAARYRWLTGDEIPSSPGQARMIDLDSMITDIHGESFAPHPKLSSLTAMNKIGQRYWLQGAEEPARAEAGDFSAVQRSNAEKTKAIARLAELVIKGDLVTQESVGDLTFAGSRVDAVKTVETVAHRMLLIQRSLGRRHGSRNGFEVTDEYDIQDLLRSILVLFFDDVREESTTPQYAGGSSRIDFVLPDFKVAIEVKKSRDSMASKSLADELIIDRDRYAADTRIAHLICLVFDHEGRLANPRGLEKDLSRESSAAGLAVTVVIVDR